ncbi:MAG: rhomboid family intramembrane serine protease [Planctomycetota bacterium]
MGIYDRDYERGYGGGGGWRPEGEGGIQLRWPRTTVGQIIVITLIAYVAQLIMGRMAIDLFSLHSDWYTRPWFAYQLLTYGFLHDPNNLMHIVFNMYGLWLFGSQLESRYGSRELLFFYLTAILAGGVLYTLGGFFTPEPSVVLGASGGTVAVTILYALLYPHRTILLMFVFPVPMWVVGCLIVGGDIFNTIGVAGANNIASSAHLGGAALALLYFRQQWRLSDWFPGEGLSMPSFKRRPKLRVHREDSDDDERGDSLDQELDRVLAKIRDQGQDSLSRKEKRILEQASRRARQKRS